MNHVKENPSRMSIDAFRDLPEGTLAELIDNVIYMSPSPLHKHQDIILKIASQCYQQINQQGRGITTMAPFDVYLDKIANVVQPDILIVLKENPSQIKPDEHFYGVPDLIIEVLSPGNKRHDLIVKKSLYERFGVKEYWIVDPETNLATGYAFSDGSLLMMAEDSGVIKSKLLNLEITF